jgi:formate--tetrahydrofolate ligase
MTQLRNILSVAEELGVPQQHVIPWGRHRAKIDLEALSNATPKGRLVLVSAINPTPPGEGKTTTSVALAMGLRKRGRRAVAALREPSLGPVFGVKGGGTGGGEAMLEPAADINLHFTGDIHAVTSAHNLLSALVDNTLHFNTPVTIDGRTVTWPRAMDMNDRALRNMVIGLGGKSDGVPREARFDITAASEVMAILGLSSSLKDLEERCARIVIARTPEGKPVRAGDIQAQAAMTALLRDALMPNLVQTREGGPALVHGGPFGNIAYGCNSILATKMALTYGEEVITEGGFGFDLGGEKFLDIKCRAAGIWPRMVVLVATLRALKFHGGVPLAAVSQPNMEGLKKGFDHLAKHLESLDHYGLPALVAVNRFPNDTEEEIEALRSFVAERGAGFATHEGFSKGGDGALELADNVLDVLAKTDAAPAKPKFLYELTATPEEKIRTVAQKIYGADDVAFTSTAKKQIETIVGMGEGNLPVCVAKTHLSLSDDASRQGRPRGFTITVREVRLSAGAGYIVPLTGEIMTMPGLPKEPASRRVVVHNDGRITGLMQGE